MSFDLASYYEMQLMVKAGYSQKRLTKILMESQETGAAYEELLRMEIDRVKEIRKRVR